MVHFKMEISYGRQVKQEIESVLDMGWYICSIISNMGPLLIVGGVVFAGMIVDWHNHPTMRYAMINPYKMLFAGFMFIFWGVVIGYNVWDWLMRKQPLKVDKK